MRHTPMRFVAEVVLALAVLVTVAPVVWLLVTAVNTPREIIVPGFSFEFSWTNLAEIFGPGSVIGQQVVNSLVITLGTVVVCLAIASLAGYSLSHLHWPPVVTWVALGAAALIQVIPPMSLVPGLYLTLQSLGLLNSLAGLILLNVVFNLPFATIMMKVYFDNVPHEIREAGLVDNASEARVFTLLMLPLVRPGLAAVGIYVAITSWNEFLMGLTLTTGGPRSPITVGIASLVQPYEINYGPMAALGAVTVIPVIALALAANRQIVAGLTGGAVK